MSRLPPGKQWLAHDGARARRRRLVQRCRPVFSFSDAPSVAALARAHSAVADDPDPEYAALNLIAGALEAAEDTGVAWHEAMTYVLDKFEARRKAGAA